MCENVMFKNFQVNLVNLTMHTITKINEDGTQESYEPSGIVARCEESNQLLFFVNGTAVYKKKYGIIKGLPPRQPNTMFLVSNIVLQAAKEQGRFDVLVPADTVRDEFGRIIGAKSWAGAGSD